ncbi:hypothetical protein PAXRUDRAFT_17472 [Paxillus rubicundulus Ve08.2h10]|uniref:Uncharacterized protein n=1 Tax=Paxillus rubicundulus Ve08.2h10 TaxID=930991 RepID=A0A0D0DHJ0_9AGAM|nr:hypothetical protein PAXRUDRAFT_17472 [Paxillus rubicundulus Ve08.2h10]
MDHFGCPLFSQPKQSGYPQGAYMQEIVLLNECCKTLKVQLLRVTIEHDTMKVIFDELSMSFDIGSPPTKSAEMYLKVPFWTQTKYNEWTTTAEAHANR